MIRSAFLHRLVVAPLAAALGLGTRPAVVFDAVGIAEPWAELAEPPLLQRFWHDLHLLCGHEGVVVDRCYLSRATLAELTRELLPFSTETVADEQGRPQLRYAGVRFVIDKTVAYGRFDLSGMLPSGRVTQKTFPRHRPIHATPEATR